LNSTFRYMLSSSISNRMERRKADNEERKVVHNLREITSRRMRQVKKARVSKIIDTFTNEYNEQ